MEYTDASLDGVGAVSSQMQNGQERALSYYSHRLSKAERNYCIARRELLAIVKAIRRFHPYRSFTIRTDHAALRWLLNFKYPEGQIARWLEELQQYDFVVEYRCGVKHINADALSRRPRLPDGCKYCERLEVKEQLQHTDCGNGDLSCHLVGYGIEGSTWSTK